MGENVSYALSEQDLENLATVVPGWFLKRIVSGADDESLKAEVKSNLVSAYELAGRDLPEGDVLEEKVDDLFGLYKDTIDGYESGEE